MNAEVGRYSVVLSRADDPNRPWVAARESNSGYQDPSRTAIDEFGNAYVANRAHSNGSPPNDYGSVSKIAYRHPQLCDELINSQVDIRWNTCLAAFDCDTELIGKMKDSGCGLVMMVDRSGNPDDKNSMSEGSDQLTKVCRMCEDGDLHYSIGKVFGGPGETKETVDQK